MGGRVAVAGRPIELACWGIAAARPRRWRAKLPKRQINGGFKRPRAIVGNTDFGEKGGGLRPENLSAEFRKNRKMPKNRGGLGIFA